MNYACVIVTFNRKNLLVEAIDSVIQQIIKPKKIIIIDNASTDGTETLLKQRYSLEDELFDYVQLKENLGGSAGFYLGIKRALQANVDWVAIADDDALYGNDYFEKMSAAIKKYPQYQVFSSTVKLPDGKIDSMHREFVKDSDVLTSVTVPTDKYSDNFEFDLFSFVGVLMSANLISTIGLPEKDYFIKFDDFEYAVRAREHTKFLNVSSAEMLHKTTDPGRSISPWKEYYVMRNRIESLNKHRSKSFKVRTFLLYFLGRKIGAIILFKERRRFFRYLLRAYVQGYKDGTKGIQGKNEQFLPGN